MEKTGNDVEQRLGLRGHKCEKPGGNSFRQGDYYTRWLMSQRLISAGYDGEYGTPDDICNFEWKYREN